MVFMLAPRPLYTCRALAKAILTVARGKVGYAHQSWGGSSVLVGRSVEGRAQIKRRYEARRGIGNYLLLIDCSMGTTLGGLVAASANTASAERVLWRIGTQGTM